MSARVLLVDDERLNRRLISLLLEKEGVEVATAASGEQGIERALAESFDLILMDLNLPNLDGASAIEKLRNHGLDMPIIVVSGSELKEEIENCFQKGCSDFLQKPFKFEEFLECLTKYLPLLQKDEFSIASNIEESEEFLIESQEVIQAYTQKLRLKLKVLETATVEQNPTLLRELAHKLSCAGLFNHPKIGEAAKKLETLLAEKDYGSASIASEELKLLILHAVKSKT